MRRLIVLTTLLGLLLIGCNFVTRALPATPAPDSPQPIPTQPLPERTPLPALTGEWTVKLHQTGGIMGLSRSVEISSDGSFTATDERANSKADGILTPTELDDLVSLIQTSEFQPNTQPYGCADCFIYEIEITSDSGNFTVTVDDVTLGDSGLESLVNMLGKLMDRELK